ncbi:Lsr2 family protein [Amycolatopsis sp. NPDC059657]|uniref:histone-like nucleoid-structuring protein Lsr2 n=1 Tax=Amycolatopsis sp. NPDC059657 TaxID=3346899 RepID=UPI003670D3D0
MAQKVFVQLADDIDGGEADQTVLFGLDGVEYEIDLSDANASELRDGLAQFVSAGRRVGGRKLRAVSDTSRSMTTAERERSQAIRAWAVANGYRIADRGRISARVTAAFAAASRP